MGPKSSDFPEVLLCLSSVQGLCSAPYKILLLVLRDPTRVLVKDNFGASDFSRGDWIDSVSIVFGDGISESGLSLAGYTEAMCGTPERRWPARETQKNLFLKDAQKACPARPQGVRRPKRTLAVRCRETGD